MICRVAAKTRNVMVTIPEYNSLEDIDNTGRTCRYSFKGTREQGFSCVSLSCQFVTRSGSLNSLGKQARKLCGIVICKKVLEYIYCV